MSGGYKVRAHNPTPPDILVVPQVLSEVQIIHEFEDEGQRMLGGGVHSDKLRNVPVLETTACQCFLVEPLRIDPQSTGHSQLGATHHIC